MKVITIVGARPQFVKSSIVSKRLKEKNIEEIYIHTGQHYDENMSDIFFEELEIEKPKYNLHIGSGSHAEQTGKMLIEIEKILLKENPNIVLLYGDTNSTLAGALAAVKLHFPIFHVEGGTRFHDLTIPEEVNRILVDHISEYIFAPTEEAMIELRKEGLEEKSLNSGDVMLDRLLDVINRNTGAVEFIKKLNLKENGFYLLTLHRPSNTDEQERLIKILETINSLDKKILFPIHPRTRENIKKFNIDVKKYKNITCVEPLGYNELIMCLNKSSGAFTDSGGLQKEACFLEKKSIVIFESSAWKELEENEYLYVWNDLSKDGLLKYLEKELPKESCHKYFGNGKATEIIVEKIKEYKND